MRLENCVGHMMKINKLATVSLFAMMLSACAVSVSTEIPEITDCCSKTIYDQNINVRHQQRNDVRNLSADAGRKIGDLAFELEKARDAAVNDGRSSMMKYYRDVYRAAVSSAYSDSYLPTQVPAANDEKSYQQQFNDDAQIIIHQPTDRTLYFEYDAVGYSDIAEAQYVLAKHRDYLLKTHGRVLVVGYADISGSADYNLALGRKRAERVKNELVTKGVPSELISVVSYGASYSPPLMSGHTDNLKLWRKVELYY